MDTIFMHSKNRKIFDPHRLLLILSDKINLSLFNLSKINLLEVGFFFSVHYFYLTFILS